MRVIKLPEKATKRGSMVHRIWITPDSGQLVVLLGHDEGANVLCWTDLAGQTVMDHLPVAFDEHDCAVPSPEFSADHRFLALSEDSVYGEITVLDRYKPTSARVVLEGPNGRQLYDQYSCVTFSPDGAVLVGAGPSKTREGIWPIHRWPTASALQSGLERLRPVPTTEVRVRHSCGPVNVAISPDGKYLATIMYDGTLVVVWDFASGDLIAELELPSGAQRHGTVYDQTLRFSPDNRTLAAAGSDLALFDVASWDLRHRLETDSEVCGMAFHPDSQRLATVDDAEEVIIWDTATSQAESLPCSDAGPLRAIAIAPDGATVVAGGEDGRLVQWELPPVRKA